MRDREKYVVCPGEPVEAEKSRSFFIDVKSCADVVVDGGEREDGGCGHETIFH